MYEIVYTKGYQKSYKKLKSSGQLKKQTSDNLKEAIDTIAKGEKLPAVYKDHKLTGEYLGFRECHIQGDLLLIYKLEKTELILALVDLGSHAALFG